ncbi:MAG: ATP-dependent Clp protease ATP-binding subunit, partial [Clostridia bacterium]|nr:ATP-dependent Clp protease ATP-binding subunit [Clostridia bacterium]
LERRFQPVMIGEPSEEDALLILKGLRDRYEAHHKVKISDDALEAAVKLSSRYIQDRFLPDKAIDLMDESASKVRLAADALSPEAKALEKELKQVVREKEAAVNNQEFESAATLRDREKELKKKLDGIKAAAPKAEKTVTAADIAETVSSMTGIPVSKLGETESERLSKLEDVIHERVIGQEKAVSAVCRAVRRGRVGLKDPRRPVGSFLFLGPTGVGKTELSKALAEAMFGAEKDMIRVDMSEYMEKHTVSKLIGSPPGYVGFDDGGQLTEKVRRRPYSVILFDEIEKAHPDVFNILLQILDDGVLTDSHGRKVDFKNTVIIMTSNVGARLITEPKTLGFSSSDKKEDFEKDQKKIEQAVMGELKNTFRPEFLNRIDEIVIFRQLTEENVKQIAGNMLKEVSKRLQDLPLAVDFDETVRDAVSKAGFDRLYGARPLRRTIQTEIEDLIATKILSGELEKGAHYKMTASEKDGKNEYSFEKL